MNEDFFESCRREVALGIMPFALRIIEERGGGGGALFQFVVDKLEITVTKHRGEMDCSFALVNSQFGSVFLSQIHSRYSSSREAARINDVEGIFEFVRENINDLIADFSALEARDTPRRLRGIERTPPLDLLSERAKESLAKRQKARQLPGGAQN
jgi:hypothetical protein